MPYNVPLGSAVDFDFNETAAFDGNAIEFDLDPPAYSPLNFNFDEIANFNGGAIDLEFSFNTDPGSGDIYDPPIDNPNPLFSALLCLSTGKSKASDRSASVLVETAQNAFDKSVSVNLDKGDPADAITRAPWQPSANLKDSNFCLLWTFPKKTDRHYRLAWTFPYKLSTESALPWTAKLVASDQKTDINWHFLSQQSALVSARFVTALKPKSATLSAGFDGMNKLEKFNDVIWGGETYAEICTQLYVPPLVPDVVLDFDSPLPSSLDFEFNTTDYPQICNTQEPSGERHYPANFPDVVVPEPPPQNEILQVYFIMHSLAVVVLPSRTAIDVKSTNLSIDIDAFAWTMSMQISDGIELIRPDINGNKEIEINIDGYIWEFIVESYTENKAFADNSWTVTGRSKTAYLSAPYKLPISNTYTSLINAAQIIDNELLNSGFTATYNTVDWAVNADAFSYQNLTAMQAIRRIADAVGGVILPHQSANSLIINPRYQSSPWNWGVATPKAIITHDIIAGMNGNWQPKPDINGVYVGGNTTGVQCFVKRTGTAGDQLAPQYIDNLITHVDPGREKGRNIIANRGKQEVVDVELPILPIGQTPEIYQCGDLLEIQETTTWRAMVLKLNIKASNDNGLISAEQTVTLEKHYGEY